MKKEKFVSAVVPGFSQKQKDSRCSSCLIGKETLMYNSFCCPFHCTYDEGGECKYYKKL